jgi:hypothetical protein
MTDFDTLRNSYLLAKHDLILAQEAERNARRALHNASGSLSTALLAHVKERFVQSTMNISATEDIQIVDFCCQVYDPTMVKAVYLQRIKSGAFGKTRTTGKVVWDFVANSWKVEG